MKPGIYNPEDPDDIQQMPDSWISIERNWIDFEYNNWILKVEVVKYLDNSVRVNAVNFISRLDEIEFLESLDESDFDESIDDKYNKMIAFIESQVC